MRIRDWGKGNDVKVGLCPDGKRLKECRVRPV